jgi:ferrochelatase
VSDVARAGVLLTAFGAPRDLDEVAPFMCSLLGCEPPAAALEGARRKYLAIGGGSPLPAMAEHIATHLERELGVPVAVGMRYADPSIDDAVARLASAGVREVVVVSLSPFDAEVTTGAYREAVEAAVALHKGMRFVQAAAYHRSDPFVEVLADAAGEAIRDAEAVGRSVVVFSAHSLPVADLERDPSYVDQLRETAVAVAARLGLGEPSGFTALPGIDAFGGPGVTSPWLLAFQSKGRRGGEWAGPDIEDVIDAAATAGFASVAVCPIGFAVDHMETLYDLDVHAADRACGAGIGLYRARVPNDAPRMIDALAQAVRRAL